MHERTSASGSGSPSPFGPHPIRGAPAQVRPVGLLLGGQRLFRTESPLVRSSGELICSYRQVTAKSLPETRRRAPGTDLQEQEGRRRALGRGRQEPVKPAR